jgi:aspartate kinase
MAAIVEALTNEGIPILQSADSNASIWVLVRQADMADAVRALHAKFGLGRTAEAARAASQPVQEESQWNSED